jgi:hypothetical protein
VDDTIATADLADGAVTSIKIADNTITGADIQDTARQLAFPANAINYVAGTVIQPTGTGLQWQANFVEGAFLYAPRPLDWDGASDVTMHLYFQTTTATSGVVDFFIRPRAFDPGDTFVDVPSLDGAGVAVSSSLEVDRQIFTIPASRFGARQLWVISIQRGGTEETYTDDVVLTAVELIYNATR